MRRHLVLGTALAAVATVAVVPSHAAKPKPKPKPITGSYAVTLPPDPTKEVGSLLEEPGCSGVVPVSIDRHAFTVPAAGTLVVKLLAQDPTNGKAGAGLDWDLYIMDAQGERNGSHGPTSKEMTVDAFKRRMPVTIEVCNLDGLPNATISYTFTYK